MTKPKKITDKMRLDWLLEEFSSNVIMVSFDGGDSYHVMRCRSEIDAAIKAERKQ